MRVTGNYLIDLASASTQKAEQQVATATQQASSGLRVDTPQVDPAAWALAHRAQDRTTLSTARGTAIAQARERLQVTDGAFGSIANLVQQARAAAVEGANGGLDANARSELAATVQGYLSSAVAIANSRTSDGEYVLGGSRSTTPPFDAAGNYAGDAGTRAIESGEGRQQTIGVPGSAITASSGIDVLPALAALATALSSNNLGAIQASIDTLSAATQQVARAQVDAGTALASLDDADGARGQLEVNLAATLSRAQDADPVEAATELAKASNALATSQAVASHVLALVQTPGQ